MSPGERELRESLAEALEQALRHELPDLRPYVELREFVLHGCYVTWHLAGELHAWSCPLPPIRDVDEAFVNDLLVPTLVRGIRELQARLN